MTINPLAIQNASDLAEFLKGRDEDELVESITKLGVAEVLQMVFDGMANAYLPEAGPHQRSLIEWQIQDPARGVHVWQTVVSREGFTVRSVATEEPDVTLRLELIPFLQLTAGELRGPDVLCSGIVKVKGNLQLAAEIVTWFPDQERTPER